MRSSIQSVHAFLLATLTGTLVCGQNSVLQGPSESFVFDALSSTIRPVIGVPGSARLGSPLSTRISQVWFAPNGASALARWFSTQRSCSEDFDHLVWVRLSHEMAFSSELADKTGAASF